MTNDQRNKLKEMLQKLARNDAFIAELASALGATKTKALYLKGRDILVAMLNAEKSKTESELQDYTSKRIDPLSDEVARLSNIDF